MRTYDDAVRRVAEEVTRRASDRGQVVDTGWRAYRKTVIPAGASPTQVAETRKAFFCGAQHLFGSIMSFLEEGVEPTEADLRRMTLISEELQAFVDEMKAV